jgi:hypothetical protein
MNGMGNNEMIALFLFAQAHRPRLVSRRLPRTCRPARWATVRIEPALGETRTEIAIGTSRYDRDRKQLDYWMRREKRDRQGGSVNVSWADSRSCPAIEAMRDMGTMQFAPPRGADDIIVSMDGTMYTLEAPGRYENAYAGTLRIKANVRTPLADWAERLRFDLANCWSERPG